MLSSQKPDGGRIREKQANTLCQHCFGGSHKMTLLRHSFLICQIGIMRVISPCFPAVVAVDLCQVFRAPEGGRVNRMRVELEVGVGGRMLQSRIKHSKSGDLVRGLYNRLVSILGRHGYNCICEHVPTCGLLIYKF